MRGARAAAIASGLCLAAALLTSPNDAAGANATPTPARLAPGSTLIARPTPPGRPVGPPVRSAQQRRQLRLARNQWEQDIRANAAGHIPALARERGVEQLAQLDR